MAVIFGGLKSQVWSLRKAFTTEYTDHTEKERPFFGGGMRACRERSRLLPDRCEDIKISY
jgi:hypothetical protein